MYIHDKYKQKSFKKIYYTHYLLSTHTVTMPTELQVVVLQMEIPRISLVHMSAIF